MFAPPPKFHIPTIARTCGRALILAFMVLVIFALFPLKISSAPWGTQLSSRIVDTTSLALVGVALLICAAFIQPMPDGKAERKAAKRLLRQRSFAVRLCQLGTIGLVLLAIWQLPLLQANFRLINERNVAQSGQLSPMLQQAAQTLRVAPAAEIEQRWQQFTTAGSPGLTSKQTVSGIEQKRQALIRGLQVEQNNIDQGINNQGSQARSAILRESLRIVALCAVFAAAFHSLRRSVT